MFLTDWFIVTGGSELLAKAQYQYLQQSEGYVSFLISALVSEDWGLVVNNCDINSWREALAATLTYSSEEELPFLCGKSTIIFLTSPHNFKKEGNCSH